MADEAAMQLPILGKLFDSLPMGIVVLDPAGRIVVYNQAEAQLAGRSPDQVMGTEFFKDVAPCMDVQQLGMRFAVEIGRKAFDTTVEMSFPFPHHEHPRDVRVRMCSLEVGTTPYGFLIIEDISLHRAVERMREKLQSLLVHDLKNPLTAVTANLDLLAEFPEIRDNLDARDAINDAIDGARRLGRMSLNLLDLPRLETATMPLRRTATDVRAMLARIVNDNRAGARAYRSRIEVSEGPPTTADIDEDLVVRALDNLVENALRHARLVTLSCERTPTALLLRVADNGPGIPERFRAALFDKYAQVETEGARGENRGLGLTFTQLVARGHGGEVELVCPPEGGSQFTLRFPSPGP